MNRKFKSESSQYLDKPVYFFWRTRYKREKLRFWDFLCNWGWKYHFYLKVSILFEQLFCYKKTIFLSKQTHDLGNFHPDVLIEAILIKKRVYPFLSLFRGFGFVRFFNEEQHSRALRQMNGAKGLGQKALHVNVASKRYNMLN